MYAKVKKLGSDSYKYSLYIIKQTYSYPSFKKCSSFFFGMIDALSVFTHFHNSDDERYEDNMC